MDILTTNDLNGLTPKAAKMVRGKAVNNISSADWTSWFNYWEQQDRADRIKSRVEQLQAIRNKNQNT